MLGLQTPQAYTLSPLLVNPPPQTPGHYLLVSHYVQCNLIRKHFRYTIKNTGNCGEMLQSKGWKFIEWRDAARGQWQLELWEKDAQLHWFLRRGARDRGRCEWEYSKLFPPALCLSCYHLSGLSRTNGSSRVLEIQSPASKDEERWFLGEARNSN